MALHIHHFEGKNGGEYKVELRIQHQRMTRICRDFDQVLQCINEIGTELGIKSAKFDTKTIPVCSPEV